MFAENWPSIKCLHQLFFPSSQTVLKQANIIAAAEVMAQACIVLDLSISLPTDRPFYGKHPWLKVTGEHQMMRKGKRQHIKQENHTEEKLQAQT